MELSRRAKSSCRRILQKCQQLKYDDLRLSTESWLFLNRHLFHLSLVLVLNMGLLAQRQIFDPPCPSGGTWYACSVDSPSQFVGCCAGNGDPCGGSSCSAGDLRAAGYDPTYYAYLPDVSCPSTSSAYKCTASISFSFFGCCKKDPCFSGSVCARSDLEAASLPSDSGAAAAFLPSSTYSSLKPTSISSATSTPPSSAQQQHLLPMETKGAL